METRDGGDTCDCRIFLAEKCGSSGGEREKKRRVTEMAKNPSLISDSRLRREVSECICLDPDSSPFVDRIRQTIGDEYEYILLEKLRNLGIPFESEEQLR